MIDARSLARALGGDVTSRDTVSAPGPGHSRKDRSLSIRLDSKAPDGFVIHSHSGDDWAACRDHVRERLGLPNWRPGQKRVTAKPRHCTDGGDHGGDRVVPDARALEVWHAARDPRGTVVEAYLRSRGLELPQEAAHQAIRFHPACPFGGNFVPAMICLVRNVLTNSEQAIHRTALTSDGQKCNGLGGNGRLSWGPTKGGAIKLTPDEDVTTCLGVGEGIETTLSLQHAAEFGRSPVWCLISSEGIRQLPALPRIECLWIATDHEEAGTKAAQAAAERWSQAGKEVFLVKANNPDSDLNDLVQTNVGPRQI